MFRNKMVCQVSYCRIPARLFSIFLKQRFTFFPQGNRTFVPRSNSSATVPSNSNISDQIQQTHQAYPLKKN